MVILKVILFCIVCTTRYTLCLSNRFHSHYHKEQLKTQASDVVLTALSFLLLGKVREVKDPEVAGEKQLFHYPSNMIRIDNSKAEAEQSQFYLTGLILSRVARLSITVS